MMNRPRFDIPPGSLLDLFGRYGYDAPDPNFGSQDATRMVMPQLPEGQSSQGYLPSFFPNLSPTDMQMALQSFGLDGPVEAYPADMAPGSIADALQGGMGGSSHVQMLPDGSANPVSPTQKALSMLQKKGPGLLGTAVGLGASMLSKKGTTAATKPQMYDIHPSPIAGLRGYSPSAFPVMQHGPMIQYPSVRGA